MPFPLAPTNGQLYTDPQSRIWQYSTIDTKWELSTANSSLLQNNFVATGAPAVTDSTSNGYAVGSYWVDVSNNKAYICTDSTTGAALWSDLTATDGWLQLAADPATPAMGDTWYNTAVNQYKAGVLSSSYGGTWQNAAGMLNPRYGHAQVGGISFALVVAGTNNLSVAAAGLITSTETYSSPAWTTSINPPLLVASSALVGTPTSALMFGGLNSVNTPVTNSFILAGTWATASNMLTPRRGHLYIGSTTLALASQGTIDSVNTLTNTTELFNGVSWASSGNHLVTDFFGSAFGTVLDTVSVGWSTAVTATYRFNGSTWSTGTPVPIAISQSASMGSTSSGFATASQATYGYSAGTWGSAPTPNTPRSASAVSTGGTMYADGLLSGGYVGTSLPTTSEETTFTTSSIIGLFTVV